MLSVSEISVQFGAKRLFDNVSFIVNSRDRIGLVGSNGSGKTTLLKIFNGEVEPDSGNIALSKHFTIDYLPQDGIKYKGKSLYEEVYSGLSDITSIKNEIEDITNELSKFTDKNSTEYLELVDKLGELQLKFEDLDGFRIKSKIEKILEGLGFKSREFANKTDEFSGGWQMRIALAKLLLKNPSILLLDEPTNHLDIDSLLWLEGYLKSYKGAIVLVSHDRQFLDNITNRTIEIYTGKVTMYNGNFSFYVKEKESRRELLEKRYENQQKYLKQQEKFIERFRYKASKATAVQSRIKMVEKIERIELEDNEKKIHFKFPPASHSGRIILELKKIKKSYGNKEVLKNLDLQIIRGDKIGLVGPNGTGKTTLAKIITGIENFEGEKKFGHMVEMEYYSQHQADTMEQNKTVFEIIESTATGEVRKYLRSILGSFLFKDDDINKSVSVLSGGEKSRLALARMLLKSSNFIILDEPTNHLDMNSKEMLMDALRKYDGSLLIISHDRIFLDGVVNKIMEIKNKKLTVYEGNLTEYLRKKEEEINSESSVKTNKSSEENNSSIRNKDKKRKEAELRNKLYSIQKPLKDKLRMAEKNIKIKETQLKEIESNMLLPEFYKDPVNIKNANKDIKILKNELDSLYHEWMELTDKLKNYIV